MSIQTRKNHLVARKRGEEGGDGGQGRLVRGAEGQGQTLRQTLHTGAGEVVMGTKSSLLRVATADAGSRKASALQVR